MLTLTQVSFKYQDTWLLKQTSFSLMPHTLTVIVGPNGAGKTTLLRLLAGIWTPTNGHVFFKGKNLQQYRRRELAQQIAFVPQQTAINYAFTVRELVMMGRYAHLNHWQPEKSRDNQCVEKAMQQADILHLANRSVVTLSGGEQQRVVIARSLASEADMILLDEPVSNLDIAHTLDMLQLCQQLVTTGKTLVLVLHDLNLALRYAEQMIVMDKGRIVGIGIPEEVLTDSLLAEVFQVKAERIVSASGTFFNFKSIP